MTARNRDREPFDPRRHLSSEASDADLTAYIEDRLGLTPAEITNVTTMLGCDGASHEVWEELVARRRRTGR